MKSWNHTIKSVYFQQARHAFKRDDTNEDEAHVNVIYREIANDGSKHGDYHRKTVGKLRKP